MDEGRLTKGLLYGELAQGTRPKGRPKLRYKDVTKRDMGQCGLDLDTWEEQVDDRSVLRRAIKQAVKDAEEVRHMKNTQKRNKRKEQQQQPQQPSSFLCAKCGRDCHSRVGLFSHSRRC